MKKVNILTSLLLALFSTSCFNQFYDIYNAAAAGATSPAQNLYFTDTDINEDQIGGTMTVTAAADESGINSYRVYFGSDTTTPVSGSSPVADLSKGGTMKAFIDADTPVPAGSEYLLVFSVDENGNCNNTPLAVELKDAVCKRIDDTIHLGGENITPVVAMPRTFAIVNEKLYFLGVGSSNYAIWEYDGTENPLQGYNLHIIRDNITDSDSDGNYFAVNYMAAQGNRLLFTESTSGTSYRIQSFDTTTSTITSIFDPTTRPRYLETMGNRVYFSAEDGSSNNDLYYFDSNLDEQLLDIVSGSYDFYPGGKLTWNLAFRAINDTLYFQGNYDTSDDYEFCMYNETDGFTRIILNASDASRPCWHTEYNGKIYFSADDGTNGKELWIYDPALPVVADSNPKMLVDINPGGSGEVQHLAVYNNRLYFSAEVLNNDQELWVYDDTLPVDVGTNPAQIANINTNTSDPGSDPSFGIVYNEKLFFFAKDSTGQRELFVYDDTQPVQAGMNPVIAANLGDTETNLGPGICPSPTEMIVFKDRLYFSAVNYYGTYISSGEAYNYYKDLFVFYYK